MSRSPLKLVHVASGDLWAGAEVQLYYLARALHAMPEARLHVVLLNHGALEERLLAAGLSVEVIEEHGCTLPRLVLALRRRLRESGAQVVHSHRYKENLLAALAAQGTGCIAVRTLHGVAEPPRGLRGRAAQWADRFSAHLQQAGVCVSPELFEMSRRRLPRLHLETIENGIDFTALEAAAAQPVDDSLLGPGLRVAFVARLVEVKRPDIFVAAAHDLAHRLPGAASFHLFGDGPLEGRCREFIERHHLENEIRMLGFRSNMPAWLARCDVLVLCSEHEGLPMVLLEAMGLGVPVVAHAVGGIPHVLQAGRYGKLVREQSSAHYADALERIGAAPQVARERALLARAHVHANYAIDVVAGRYLGLYQRLLGQKLQAASPLHPEATQ